MDKENKQTFSKLEKIVKGFSNHWRIGILMLLAREPELSVVEIVGKLNMNYKTASEHIRRMALAGLIAKRYDNANVRHKLTSRGESILKFLRILE